jgi:branched-chain amino acid transport system ATP-binding protein
MTVLENVLVGVRPQGKSQQRDEEKNRQKPEDAAWDALERCGIPEHAGKLPGSLPYATRKRVELARALAGRPRILMLDEPAGGLDAEEITWLASLIRDAGTTVLLVEHHMDLVMSVCDEVLVLDFGKPIALGPPSEIRTDPKVTEAYLGATA